MQAPSGHHRQSEAPGGWRPTRKGFCTCCHLYEYLTDEDRCHDCTVQGGTYCPSCDTWHKVRGEHDVPFTITDADA